jgi:hypothetical protein
MGTMNTETDQTSEERKEEEVHTHDAKAPSTTNRSSTIKNNQIVNLFQMESRSIQSFQSMPFDVSQMVKIVSHMIITNNI